MYLVRSQLQTAVDAGALAAGLRLREKPDDVNEALKKASEYVQKNRAGALVKVPKEAITVTAGTWDSTTRTFTPNTTIPDAIEVSGTLTRNPFSLPKCSACTRFDAAIRHCNRRRQSPWPSLTWDWTRWVLNSRIDDYGGDLVKVQESTILIREQRGEDQPVRSGLQGIRHANTAAPERTPDDCVRSWKLR